MKKLLSILLAAALLAAVPALAAEAPPQPDHSGLVTDAYTYEYTDDWGVCEFHIPQVNGDEPGLDPVNGTIWDTLYLHIAETASAVDGGYSPMDCGMTYEWNVSGDVLSICVDVATNMNDLHDFYVYNVLLTDGGFLSDRELLAAVGVTREEYTALARDGLAAKFDRLYSAVPDDDFKAQQRARTVSDENALMTRPYLGRDGAIWAVGHIYAIAGAERYDEKISLTGESDEDRVTYFIEHCDREYLTEADIDGFDADMCVYARNGIYARSGRQFLDPDLQNYYSQFTWYEPTVAPAAFTEAYLNDFQMKNMALILKYEESLP